MPIGQRTQRKHHVVSIIDKLYANKIGVINPVNQVNEFYSNPFLINRAAPTIMDEIYLFKTARLYIIEN